MFIDRKVNNTHWKVSILKEVPQPKRSQFIDYKLKFKRMNNGEWELSFDETFVAKNKHELGDKVVLFLIEQEVQTVIDEVLQKYKERNPCYHLDHVSLARIWEEADRNIEITIHASTFLQHVQSLVENMEENIYMTDRDKSRFRVNYHEHHDNKFKDAFKMLHAGDDGDDDQ